MDDAARLKICRLVAGIVGADDDFDPEEDEFMNRLLDKFGLRDSAVIFPFIDPDDAAVEMRELPADVKEEALTLLLSAACADGHVAESEWIYLHTVAEALGLPPEEINRRIEALVNKG